MANRKPYLKKPLAVNTCTLKGDVGWQTRNNSVALQGSTTLRGSASSTNERSSSSSSISSSSRSAIRHRFPNYSLVFSESVFGICFQIGPPGRLNVLQPTMLHLHQSRVGQVTAWQHPNAYCQLRPENRATSVAAISAMDRTGRKVSSMCCVVTCCRRLSHRVDMLRPGTWCKGTCRPASSKDSKSARRTAAEQSAQRTSIQTAGQL